MKENASIKIETKGFQEEYILKKDNNIGRFPQYIKFPDATSKYGVSKDHIRIYKEDENSPWKIERKERSRKPTAPVSIFRASRSEKTVNLQPGIPVELRNEDKIIFFGKEERRLEVVFHDSDRVKSEERTEYNSESQICIINIGKNKYYRDCLVHKRIPKGQTIEEFAVKIFKDLLKDDIEIRDKDTKRKGDIGGYYYNYGDITVALRNKEKLDSFLLIKDMLDTANKFKMPELIGKSPAIKRIKDEIKYFSGLSEDVLVTGETGSGKEIVSKLIVATRHGINYSSVTQVYDLKMFPPELIQSVLFGSKKGSFSGAFEDNKGIFRDKSTNDVIIDEIGNIPKNVQPALLRIIENKEFYTVGDIENIKRFYGNIVFSTNIDLEEETKQGRFNEALYGRIVTRRIHIPPLRERKEDIPLLAEYFARQKNQPLKKEDIKHLKRYDWSRNNVRELRDFVALLGKPGFNVEKEINALMKEMKKTHKTQKTDRSFESIAYQFDEYFEQYRMIENKEVEKHITRTAKRKLLFWGWLKENRDSNIIQYERGKCLGEYYICHAVCNQDGCNKEKSDQINLDIALDDFENLNLTLDNWENVIFDCDSCRGKRKGKRNISDGFRIESTKKCNFI